MAVPRERRTSSTTTAAAAAATAAAAAAVAAAAAAAAVAAEGVENVVAFSPSLRPSIGGCWSCSTACTIAQRLGGLWRWHLKTDPFVHPEIDCSVWTVDT